MPLPHLINPLYKAFASRSIFFHDKMDAIKAIAMVLAIWGFVSYVYQCYLENKKSNSEYRSGSEVSKSPLLEEVS